MSSHHIRRIDELEQHCTRLESLVREMWAMNVEEARLAYAKYTIKHEQDEGCSFAIEQQKKTEKLISGEISYKDAIVDLWGAD